MPDLVLDIPMASMHMGLCVGHALAHQYLPKDFLADKTDLLKSMVNTGHAEKIVVAIFRSVLKEKNAEVARDMYLTSSIKFAQLLKSNGNVKDDMLINQNLSKFLESNADLVSVFGL